MEMFSWRDGLNLEFSPPTLAGLGCETLTRHAELTSTCHCGVSNPGLMYSIFKAQGDVLSNFCWELLGKVKATLSGDELSRAVLRKYYRPTNQLSQQRTTSSHCLGAAGMRSGCGSLAFPRWLWCSEAVSYLCLQGVFPYDIVVPKSLLVRLRFTLQIQFRLVAFLKAMLPNTATPRWGAGQLHINCEQCHGDQVVPS